MPKQSSASSVRSGSTVRVREDDRSTLRHDSPSSSDNGDHEDNDDLQIEGGGYEAQRDLILQEEEESSDDDEEFVYPGAAEVSVSSDYTSQLADALEDDVSETHSDELDEPEATDDASRRLSMSSTLPNFEGNVWSDQSSPVLPKTPPRISSPPSSGISITTALESPQLTNSHPFLHPSVSRLRSFAPRSHQHSPSSSSVTTLNTGAHGLLSPSPSHFSSISRVSSISNLHSATESHASHASEQTASDRTGIPKPLEIFRWTNLRQIGDGVFLTASQKASAVLGSTWGTPTVMAANGLICIGTDLGIVLVFDFRQQYKFTCGSETSQFLGAVTALALSYDHTFLAVGHQSGHINLFELSHPQSPVRSVPPITLSAVSSGRKEGHLLGSAVTQIGFISTRHTALVSSDDSGLAFYHSLGKVLFVESTDVLRILGKYPEDDVAPAKEAPLSANGPETPKGSTFTFPANSSNGAPRAGTSNKTWVQAKRSHAAILAAAPLPLGTTAHPTDTYNLIALLTPIKLVVVGLKPSPRTWFRKHRASGEGAEREDVRSRWFGCIAWYPSVSLDSSSNDGTSEMKTSKDKFKSNGTTGEASIPVLAYSWGKTLRILKVREEKITQNVDDKRTGKKKVVEVGQVAFEEALEWITDGDVVALQWLNINQLVAITLDHLEVFDAKTGALIERVTFNAISKLTSLYGTPSNPSDIRVSHSVRMYKGKIFLLGSHDVRVGTLLSWADRILAFVEEGDFLSAIDLTRAYYVGTAPGNRNGLPEDQATLRQIVGKKLSDLMVASAAYAFSEDRLRDHAHQISDGRGVDRTPLFEELVTSCVQASLSLDDCEFLYEDLYERYQSSGITSIFLQQLEPFILDGSLRTVPTYVTQQLITLHAERGEFARAELVIWHSDPVNLDSNQAVKLCQRYELYDALIYVFTRTLQDFASPVVELLALVRKIQQARSRGEASGVERHVPNAYKLHSYLTDVLQGLTYPSKDPLPAELAVPARKDVYQFLFSGHSTFWPPGSGGRLILTADEDGGVEPTYPYLRLLLRFDAEAFLHVLDIAFEDPYLNDSPQGVSRQAMVNILLKIIAPDDPAVHDLSSSDVTFIRIFVCRNVPKYFQFIDITLTAQQDLLLELAADPDQSTTEDRQLAAEFLLSTYTPHDRDELIQRFREAGFFRILRSWYRHDEEWPQLITTYIQDPDLPANELFPSLDAVLKPLFRAGRGSLPLDVHTTLLDSLPQLVGSEPVATAGLLDRYSPDSHAQAVHLLGEGNAAKQFAYLTCLLAAEPPKEGSYGVLPSKARFDHLDHSLRVQYLHLMSRFDAAGLIPLIKRMPDGYFDTTEVIEEAEEAGDYDVAVWMLDRLGKTTEAFARIESASKGIANKVAQVLLSSGDARVDDIGHLLAQQRALIQMGVELCQRHQNAPTDGLSSSEDMWFDLLRSQLEMVQSVVANTTLEGDTGDEVDDLKVDTINQLRQLLQDTLSQLVSQASARQLSFPRLFERLVDTTATSRSSKAGFYAEFRLILTGMLESYHLEGDFLTLNNRLVEQDLFETIAESVKARNRGWRATVPVCAECQQSLAFAVDVESSEGEAPQVSVAVFRSGKMYHTACLPANTPMAVA